ncbi:MAG: amidohydrolase [Ruminococcus sp.]|nr:amidohydrolase [Ruminococcus sp.]
MKIYNARIHTMTDKGIIERGFVCVENGKIVKVCDGVPEVIEFEDIDAEGSILLPGFIDAHTHLGILENGLDFEGDDCNEASDPFTPQMRVIDGVNPYDYCFKEAVMGGVTTVMTSPGSANTCGGSMLVMKTTGTCADDMAVAAAGMKFALGENPKSVYNGRDESPKTRMAAAAIIREGLYKAKRYLSDCEAAEEDSELPDFDAKCEALIPLLKGDMKAHFHCHRADDICTAIRIAKEFHLDAVIVHGTEAHLIPEIIKKTGVPVICGPILCDRCKPEMKNLTIEAPAILRKHDINIAICTDHTVIPIQYLSATAALAVKGGMSEDDALYSITKGSACILGVEERMGSIAEGMDADLQMYRKDPLDLREDPWFVMIDGKECVNNGFR